MATAPTLYCHYIRQVKECEALLNDPSITGTERNELQLAYEYMKDRAKQYQAAYRQFSEASE